MPDVNQLAPCEHAQDKGAEIPSCASWCSEARDHAFLRKPRLYLQPLPAPSAHAVHTLRMLGHDPFEPLFFGGPEEKDALFRYVIAEFYVWGRREDLSQ